MGDWSRDTLQWLYSYYPRAAPISYCPSGVLLLFVYKFVRDTLVIAKHPKYRDVIQDNSKQNVAATEEEIMS